MHSTDVKEVVFMVLPCLASSSFFALVLLGVREIGAPAEKKQAVGMKLPMYAPLFKNYYSHFEIVLVE